MTSTPSKVTVGMMEASKEYAPEELGKVFLDAKNAVGKDLNPEIFYRSATSSGTHSLKSINPKIPRNLSYLRARPAGRNHLGKVWPTGNAGEGPYHRILAMPINIKGGGAPRSILDHIIEPDHYSPLIFEAFSHAFGSEVLNNVVISTRTEPEYAGAEHHEVPIVFIPTELGDVQITPVTSFAAFAKTKSLLTEYHWWKVGKEGRRVDQVSQSLSGQAQNIAPPYKTGQPKFRASFPRGLSVGEAQAMAFACGGRFPRLRSGDLRAATVLFLERYKARMATNLPKVRSALQHSAKAMFLSAAEERDAFLTLASTYAETDLRAPSVRDIVFSSFREDRDAGLSADLMRAALMHKDVICVQEEVERS